MPASTSEPSPRSAAVKRKSTSEVGASPSGCSTGTQANGVPAPTSSSVDQLARDGAVLTEFPLHTRPFRAYFPRRNRLVSGLALGVLVIEAARRSGALITADWALAQGREVFALPGRVDRRASQGCHQLIKAGARLVETDQDVLDALGDVAAALAPARPKRRAPRPELTPDQATVLAAVGDEPAHIDSITAATGLPAHSVASILMLLELKKLVTQLQGKHFVRAATGLP